MEIIVGTQLSNVAAQTTLDIQGLVTSMQASGMSRDAIKQTLMADLTGGGRLFGNYRNQVKNTVKTGIGMAGNNASRSAFTKAGVEQFQWISVGDGKVCPDCEERHGQVESLKYWELIGTPQSGFSVCQQNCRCQLLPESYKGENLEKPLLRDKKVKRLNESSFLKAVNDAVKLGALGKSDIKYLRSIASDTTAIKESYPILIKSIRTKEASLKAPKFSRPLKEGKLLTEKELAKLGVTENNAGSIRGYMRDGYLDLNSYSRGIKGFETPSQIINASSNLSRALSKLPNYKGDVVRFLGFSNREWSKIRSSFEIGGVFTDKGFMSASRGMRVNKNFGGGDVKVKLRIKSKTGKDISLFGDIKYRYEKEILFDKNTSFNVKSVKVDGNIYEIELWEI